MHETDGISPTSNESAAWFLVEALQRYKTWGNRATETAPTHYIKVFDNHKKIYFLGYWAKQIPNQAEKLSDRLTALAVPA
tara:strand:- start:100 stop:339 length:240 start_codon:yes stop_codon:yes gene_type:complete